MKSPNPNPTRRWMILAVLGTAQLMIVLDATVVNIALPSAQHALGFSNANRQWVVIAYALAFGSLLLLGGRLSDWFGRKLTLIAGLSGFAIASAVGGAAQSFGMLIAARALQGAFGALLAPSGLSLLSTAFTDAIFGLTRLQARFGPRPIVVVGMTLGSLGMLDLTRIGVESSYAAEVLPALAVLGVGLGLVISTSINNATLGVDADDAGVASATVNASQQISGSLGTALLSSIALSAATHYLAGAHHGSDPAGHAAVHGYAVAFAWAAAIFAFGALVSATLFRRRGRAPQPGDQSAPARQRVVVVGGGFGGLQATLKLARLPVEVVLVDRRNFHFFQHGCSSPSAGPSASSPVDAAPPANPSKPSRPTRWRFPQLPPNHHV